MPNIPFKSGDLVMYRDKAYWVKSLRAAPGDETFFSFATIERCDGRKKEVHVSKLTLLGD
jgi:hypothetical protein